jgi:hypothetical protein
MMAAYVGMTIALYPLLQKQNASLALGYVGFRLVAAACIVMGVILLLLLLTLSQEFSKAGAPTSSHFQTIGEMLRNSRDLVNHVGTIYQSNLVPRWLSGWGLAGTVVAIAASCLFMVRTIDLLTSVYLNFPLALQEIVFAGWLIMKGFNSSAAVAALFTKTNVN